MLDMGMDKNWVLWVYLFGSYDLLNDNLDLSRTGMLENAIPLYCERSSNRLHVVGTIYRPFLVKSLLTNGVLSHLKFQPDYPCSVFCSCMSGMT